MKGKFEFRRFRQLGAAVSFHLLRVGCDCGPCVAGIAIALLIGEGGFDVWVAMKLHRIVAAGVQLTPETRAKAEKLGIELPR